jgi:cytochrome c-type biogenesis protein CcmH/NrfF
VIALPLAHLGHWYHSLLYLAPVAIVVVAVWVIERREKRREATRPPPDA